MYWINIFASRKCKGKVPFSCPHSALLSPIMSKDNFSWASKKPGKRWRNKCSGVREMWEISALCGGRAGIKARNCLSSFPAPQSSAQAPLGSFPAEFLLKNSQVRHPIYPSCIFIKYSVGRVDFFSFSPTSSSPGHKKKLFPFCLLPPKLSSENQQISWNMRRTFPGGKQNPPINHQLSTKIHQLSINYPPRSTNYLCPVQARKSIFQTSLDPGAFLDPSLNGIIPSIPPGKGDVNAGMRK